ncbi:pseudouridine synthase [Halteromyces radiatus]|uniref:pseudouridine synthase n=1 Tax=Halteromyces radiatus TaxID=101107 RepID=UPI00221E9B55|nr:pseudouridine synthase [Halteromyces radiatus]KAI8096451.1 pseudouridine synthase [Halteromyces radiatus]
MGNIFSKSTASTTSTLGKRVRGEEDEDNSKRVKVDIPPVLESDVGISAFVNPDLTGFHCILKNRAEDFLVNEVDLDGHVVRLTSFEQPKTHNPARMDKLTDSELDAKMEELFDAKVAKEFRYLLDHRDEIDRVVSIQTTKETRQELYKIISTFDTPLKSSVKDGLLTICWPENTENVNRRIYIDYLAMGGDYLQFNVYKTNIDTMGAANWISKIVKVPGKNISYAGTKDARAITVQSMTISKGRPDRFEEVKDELKEHGISVGNFKFTPKGLTLGDSDGNHFGIVLRDVSGADEDSITTSLNSLKSQGFLNYYGMQRFGTSSILTHEIGRKILQKDYATASDLILMPRAGDGPSYAKARELWAETKDPKATLAIFPRRANAEIKMLKSYERFPGNHQKAIKNITRNLYLLYIHAYQSYIWNRVVSERVKRFGCTAPIVGDLVMVEPNDDDIKKKQNGQVSNNVGRRDPWARKVPLVLTEENIHSYSIKDVVYPVPGRRTILPKNEIGDLFQEYLAEDKLNLKDNVFDDIPGDYRTILSVPDNMSWSFIRYNDPTEKLVNTDLDTALGEPQPVGEPDGKHLALRVEFTLGSSQYATMALREIIRIETSSQSQSKLVHSL